MLLDDYRIQLCVEQVIDERIETRVLVGGTLSSRKGINVLGGGLSAPALTDKDKADILTARLLEADYIAVSFPRSAADLEEARTLIRASGSRAAIVAKVERAEVVVSVAAMDELIHAADLIMVARGDLGVEIGDARLPGVQKRLIRRCRALYRPVITATQMMESMIASLMPTRRGHGCGQRRHGWQRCGDAIGRVGNLPLSGGSSRRHGPHRAGRRTGDGTGRAWPRGQPRGAGQAGLTLYQMRLFRFSLSNMLPLFCHAKLWLAPPKQSASRSGVPGL